MDVTQLHSQRKASKELTKVTNTATDSRVEHFCKVAQSLGFADDKEAFKAMGVEFIKIAKKDAPSITQAQKEFKTGKR